MDGVGDTRAPKGVERGRTPGGHGRRRPDRRQWPRMRGILTTDTLSG
jgi:hypothetical protein